MLFLSIKNLTLNEFIAQVKATYIRDVSGVSSTMGRTIEKLDKDIANCEKGLAAFRNNNKHYQNEAMFKTTVKVLLVGGLALVTGEFFSLVFYCMTLPIVPYFVGADLTICMVGISPLALGAIVTACAIFSLIAVRKSFNLVEEAKLVLEEAPVKHETERLRLAMLRKAKTAIETVQTQFHGQFDRPVEVVLPA